MIRIIRFASLQSQFSSTKLSSALRTCSAKASLLCAATTAVGGRFAVEFAARSLVEPAELVLLLTAEEFVVVAPDFSVGMGGASVSKRNFERGKGEIGSTGVILPVTAFSMPLLLWDVLIDFFCNFFCAESSSLQ
jgi:hypothetical protein